ncbi:hypothetical protein [Microbacterium sp. NPDC096154]|uniref:hypothetical protein n=1 Tax=Microbacterium sp. NPDC096154 TaxID=3155549 RepID=UPI00332BB6B7
MMRCVSRVAAASVVAGLLACGVVSAAHALWSAADAEPTAPVAMGRVAFGANPAADPEAAVYTPDGGPVEVRIPGATIAEVLGHTGIAPDPVIWRFQARGYAEGITGLAFDVAAARQVAADGTTIALDDGYAAERTVLRYSTMRVYPAAAGGDCSAVPALPADAGGRNVLVYDGAGHVLQAPGAYGGETVQDWCVAIGYNAPPDGLYRNTASAVGTGDDGRQASALSEWITAVGYPPTLDSVGEYANAAETSGTAVDGTSVSDAARWAAVLYPDASGEPDVILTLDPVVTSLRPDVAPGDHFGLESAAAD